MNRKFLQLPRVPSPPRDTGFHPSDPDWTQGRQDALDEAEAIVGRQNGMARKVTLRSAPESEG